jgi:hypothetical protein
MLSHSLLFGIAFAVRMAIFMGMTNPLVAATQFTTYMALSNVAISIGNYWQGVVAERFDYSTALYIDAAIIILALCVMPFLLPEIIRYQSFSGKLSGALGGQAMFASLIFAAKFGVASTSQGEPH